MGNADAGRPMGDVFEAAIAKATSATLDALVAAETERDALRKERDLLHRALWAGPGLVPELKRVEAELDQMVAAVKKHCDWCSFCLEFWDGCDGECTDRCRLYPYREGKVEDKNI